MFARSLARLISTTADLQRSAMQIGQRVATHGKLRQFNIKKPVAHRPFRYSDANESVTCVALDPFQIQILISVFADQTFRYSLYRQKGQSIDPSPSETLRIEDGGQQSYDLDRHDIDLMIDDLATRLNELSIGVEDEELISSGRDQRAKLEDFLKIVKDVKLNAVTNNIAAVVKRIHAKQRAIMTGVDNIDNDIPTINGLTNLAVALGGMTEQLGEDNLKALWKKGPR